MTHAVSLQGVSCVFQSGGRPLTAVDDVSIDIEPGEFFTLLGPSGSGKTTCLRMIGGFTAPSSGSIRIHGEEVGDRPPYLRPVTTVFQDYALFPHMSVLDNVAYSLMVRGVARDARQRRARELLDLVRLPDAVARRPAQQYGGQRQRVALARALVSEPRVLLLDEPLGALDLKLREQMQGELKDLQRRLGITFVLVTHDQHEALSMSDRIGVFNRGRLEQVATPAALYERPRTPFVAQFLGAANLFEGDAAQRLAGAPSAVLRPERIRLGGADGARLSGTVAAQQYFGAFWRISVASDALTLLVDLPPHAARPSIGDPAHLHWDADAVHPLAAA
jgi:putative spermidine/putrescine transport system ATP-binding protein